ncbi:unnamed protein product [Psylliodes chrysocephalus]|uniref:Uncharacterized protein n=1 Tax=Psylliodes chrysocephalus TaxID=3402493 RepID=A0A9P0G7M0_9CUCU|nr:unnamed protein product [Psylliodes chrysocephala]
MLSTPSGSSDYRRSLNENTIKSYSSALTQHHYPTKEQAIIFPAIDNTKIQEYLVPLGAIIEPKNILFSSRLSNNRVCMYLASKDIVEKFINDHRGVIIINNETIQARKLITPSTRLVLSNVCPTIPHTVLTEQLEKMGLKLHSPMTFLRIGASLPEFSHIFSFRRQIFINPPEGSIPESFVVDYENTTYRIFLSQDSLVCYSCKQEGHTAAANCKTSPQSQSLGNPDRNHLSNKQTSSSQSITACHSPAQNTSTEIYSEQTTSQSLGNSNPTEISNNQTISSPPSQNVLTAPNSDQATLILQQQAIMETANIQQKQKQDNSGKRTFEEIATPPPDISDNTAGTLVDPFIKPLQTVPSKKPKNKQDTPTVVLMEPLRTVISEQSPPFVLDFEQISDLFENTYGSTEPVSITLNYTKDLVALVDMLTKIHPYFKHRSIKTRCTNLRKKILKHLQTTMPDLESSEAESDCSQESSY